MIAVIAYVLMNPVRAGITADFMTYPWSSAQSYYQGECPVADREYVQEFERMKGIDIDAIDVGKYAGKRLRGELLVYLKDNGGLTYGEIAEMFVFRDIQMVSLGKLYQDAQRRLKRRSQEVKHRAR